MGDAVLAQTVSQVVVEASADIPIDRLQLNQDQWQTVDEANQVCAPVVVRYPHTLHLQFANGKEAIVGDVTEIDHASVGVTRFAFGIAPLDGNSSDNEAVEIAIVLQKRTCEVDTRQCFDGPLNG